MTSSRPDKSKLYYPKMPAMWWLGKRNYFIFMMRELSSVFVALFLVIFLVQLYQLGEGRESYAEERSSMTEELRLGRKKVEMYHIGG